MTNENTEEQIAPPPPDFDNMPDASDAGLGQADPEDRSSDLKCYDTLAVAGIPIAFLGVKFYLSKPQYQNPEGDKEHAYVEIAFLDSGKRCEFHASSGVLVDRLHQVEQFPFKGKVVKRQSQTSGFAYWTITNVDAEGGA